MQPRRRSLLGWKHNRFTYEGSCLLDRQKLRSGKYDHQCTCMKILNIVNANIYSCGFNRTYRVSRVTNIPKR